MERSILTNQTALAFPESLLWKHRRQWFKNCWHFFDIIYVSMSVSYQRGGHWDRGSVGKLKHTVSSNYAQYKNLAFNNVKFAISEI